MDYRSKTPSPVVVKAVLLVIFILAATINETMKNGHCSLGVGNRKTFYCQTR
jgi:hypothetical protein